ncbi:U32 family peptidase [Conexivisphaera calida]|uniref:Predicted protease of the collagenase family n=1 Tax=Conexivisphaera calida TaxID=1874277 RepID=A0A4P2VDY1_9ARCH|nr:U32 family peptidase [Conexivisphaera calida]BBE42277.1 Predicted protease of the collagenase family [Conexivisphaera calida]
MELVVGTNFDDSLVDAIRGYPVRYLFGSHRKSPTGHGRSPSSVPDVDGARLRVHVSVAHSAGIKFLYAMNSVNLGGNEYRDEFWRRLDAEVEELLGMGVDGFIVANPLILERLKREHPGTEVAVSSFAKVTYARELERLAGMGADVVIMHQSRNRNFRVLSELARVASRVGVELELIATDVCLWGCPFFEAHINLMGEATREDGRLPPGSFGYPFLYCAASMADDPANLVRSRWIRPEDVAAYERIGIGRFKIGSRRWSTEKIVRSVRAYSEGRYDGNLLDILEYMGGFVSALASASGNASAERSWMGALGGIRIENSRFPRDWMRFFMENECETMSCEECRYCDGIARSVVRLPEGMTPGVSRVPYELVIRGWSDSGAADRAR